MLDRPETLSLLRMAHDEVLTLRRQVADLAPKAHAYDTLAAFARLKDEPSQGYGVDVAWRLKEVVEKLVAEREAERGDPQVEPTA